MNWMFWLSLAVVVTVIAAVTGIKPKNTRHVAGSKLMGMGRVFLFILVAIFVYMAWQGR